MHNCTTFSFVGGFSPSLALCALSYSADYIAGPSEKQFNSNRDFQSDLILQT